MANGSSPTQDSPYVIVVSESDPVALAVAAHWGTPPATGDHVDGAPLRRLSPGALLLRRPGPHIADEGLDARLPVAIRETTPTLVFPSIHRSEQNIACLTVHPLGNPLPVVELGGGPETLVPTDPLRMVSVLRRMAESESRTGLQPTYEATHHGPSLSLPAMFVEIGYGTQSAPPPAAARVLAEILRAIEPSVGDTAVLGVGGGHYAPHFTDLALRRRWAFGHVLSRHVLPGVSRTLVERALELTPGATGFLPARAQDAMEPAIRNIAPRLREGAAPRRIRDADGAPTGASGT